MTGMFDDGQIPPDEMDDEDNDWIRNWAAKRVFSRNCEKSTWGPDFNMRSVFVQQSQYVGKMLVIDNTGAIKPIDSGEVRCDAPTADLDAKAAAQAERIAVLESSDDGYGDTLGSSAVGHLREMYPSAYEALGPSGRRSLRNYINARAALGGKGE